jgi:hypothetical protein
MADVWAAGLSSQMVPPKTNDGNPVAQLHICSPKRREEQLLVNNSQQ